ncbi:MAG: hypothetical protein U1F53_01440 [Burkholderiaceae bacterium]
MDVWHVVLTGCVAGGDGGPLAVPRWLREARQLAAAGRVTGGLLFDGERWVQLFEGGQEAVDEIARALVAHADMGAALVLAESGRGAARCRDWLAAYVEPDALATLQARFVGDGEAATDELVRMMMAADPF